MQRFLGFLSVVLVSLIAVSSASADEKTPRKKVEVDFSWTSDLATANTSDSDRSLNLGKDAFDVFANYAKKWQGPFGWGAGGGTRENQASIWLWGTRTPGHRIGESHDLFNQREVIGTRSGAAFGLNLRVATGDKWRATIGYSQGRKLSIRERSFRDYVTVDGVTVEWLTCGYQPFCGGNNWFFPLTTLELSRQYQSGASNTTIRTHALSFGGERDVISGKRSNVSLTGGLDLWLYRANRETENHDYDYRRFYPEGIFGNERYSGRLADYRTETRTHKSNSSSVIDVQPRPYLGARVGCHVFRNLGVNSQVRWYPLAEAVPFSHDSVLDSYSTLTRPTRFTFTAGATLAF